MVVTCTSLYFLSRVFYLIVYILIVYIDSFFVSSSSLPRLVYVMCHVNESALPYYPLISELKKKIKARQTVRAQENACEVSD